MWSLEQGLCVAMRVRELENCTVTSCKSWLVECPFGLAIHSSQILHSPSQCQTPMPCFHHANTNNAVLPHGWIPCFSPHSVGIPENFGLWAEMTLRFWLAKFFKENLCLVWPFM